MVPGTSLATVVSVMLRLEEGIGISKYTRVTPSSNVKEAFADIRTCWKPG